MRNIRDSFCGVSGRPPLMVAQGASSISLPEDVREQIRARPGLTTVRSELTGGIYQKVEGRWVRVDSEPPAGAKALQRVSGAASLFLSPSVKDIPKQTLRDQAEAAERRFRSPRHLRLKGVLKRALAEAGVERASLGDAMKLCVRSPSSWNRVACGLSGRNRRRG
ncbi:MAG TPA: hypothetical protein PK349_11555 [Candidatus Hydrogenedentes bacterium]|nr:hypothetical protein [Candidatus Hydrogenedentota bacterium]